MILLEITNASELIATKLGDFVERLTPDFVDDSTVEDLVLKRMIENLSQEGIKGEVSLFKGLQIEGEKMILTEGFKVRSQRKF